ncbi:MAG: DUF1501 domain-containing protein [Planctomycetota bacterium]
MTSHTRGTTRRQLLARSGAVGAAALTTPAWLAPTARAAASSGPAAAPHTLVLVFLRGGMDGLSLVVPHGDGDYYAARSDLAVPPPGQPSGALDLDGFFGLNPNAAPLLDAWGEGKLAIVHAAGSTDPTRSHFEAFTRMEFGIPELPLGSANQGWLARHLLATAPAFDGAPLRAISFDPVLPQTLAQAPATLPIPDFAEFQFPGAPATASAREAVLRAVYRGEAPPVGPAALSTLNAIDLYSGLDLASHQPGPGVSYPDTEFGEQLKQCAALFANDVAPEALMLSTASWDHHSAIGPLEGIFAQMSAELAAGLAAFLADTAAFADRYTIVVKSEFGRRVAQNGSLGLDHGHGNAMLLLGNGVAGGQVHGAWPGLAEAQLDQGDVAITTDFRDVLGEVLVKRLGTADLGAVFPEHVYAPIGVLS